ncbi:related to Sulfite oxidase [Sporisorium reilianum SRZ2]|uniref:Related to Sulfite oxidase n=1 Tax=Sporisorium reilianum (strain SRZ2) TaxID=999809 RepID=E6ZV84_SPORE|nr:related to Sulfite oxidase [Sporisorium reilianum SRZ2]
MSQLVRQESPLNTEPPTKHLASTFITPSELIFNRNHDSVIHADTPTSSTSSWTIGISVDQDDSLTSLQIPQQTLSLDALQRQHELVEVVATLECAGNRRAELAASHQPAEGIQWGNAVIANVIWGGASLRSVLLDAGVPDPFQHHADLTSLEPSSQASLRDAADWSRSLHLHLYSAQESTESDDPTRKEFFAASIPLATAMHPNQHCLLAYQYNHAPLTQRHGAPVRAVVPGHVGARWVKWLNALRISTRENDSPPMRQDYKLLVPPQAHTQAEEKAFAEKAASGTEFRKEQLSGERPLQRLHASCSVTQPWRDGQELSVDAGGRVEVKGYAVGQDGSPATHIYVAIVPDLDAQSTSTEDLLTALPADLDWTQAEIHTQGSHPNKWSWAWTLWQLHLPAPAPDKKWAIVARCVTASGVQQQKISDWNLRGFHNRSWSVVRNLSVQT